ncbi:hypothetical protein [Acaryochloris marina]|nr:hypothetical protein [Acaryochloris marina]
MNEPPSSADQSMKSKLFQSCMNHSLKFMSDSMATEMCDCMAQEFIDHEMVTDEMREELAIDWNAGINLRDGGFIDGKKVEWMGIGLLVWGNCMKKLCLGWMKFDS